ncbi:hypothetical protein V1502_03385 [Bacillus sp. SCS-153A]
MTDWNEQAAPNNNLGSTSFKKALAQDNPTKTDKQKDKEKKHDRS